MTTTPSDSPAIRAALGIPPGRIWTTGNAYEAEFPMTIDDINRASDARQAFFAAVSDIYDTQPTEEHTMPDESKLTGWIGPDGKPEVYHTPLQTLAAQIKALTWTDMETLCNSLDNAFRGHAENVRPFELLAAAYALGAKE